MGIGAWPARGLGKVKRGLLSWWKSGSVALGAVAVGRWVGSVAQLAARSAGVLRCWVGSAAAVAPWLVGMRADVLAVPDIAATCAGLEGATVRSAADHLTVKLNIVRNAVSGEGKESRSGFAHNAGMDEVGAVGRCEFKKLLLSEALRYSVNHATCSAWRGLHVGVDSVGGLAKG